MKTLIILRHGKAEIGDFDTDDFDRNITDRGRKNASDMGKFIHHKINLPDLVLASDAKRTTETAKSVCESINYPKENILFNTDLYLASMRRILKIVFNLSDEINSCVMVAHNPGLTDLINYFGVRLDNLPTASAVCFYFETDEWNKISVENAKFQWIQLARNL